MEDSNLNSCDGGHRGDQRTVRAGIFVPVSREEGEPRDDVVKPWGLLKESVYLHKFYHPHPTCTNYYLRDLS